MIDRRQFIQAGLAGTLLSVPCTRMAFAGMDLDARLVLIILRGGMDGLAAVPAYGEHNYEKLRGTLALPGPGAGDGVLDLDGFFGLHPSCRNLHAFYGQGELIVAHAVATSYRDRSHFDGQKQLENGTNHPLGSLDGWLNRALADIASGNGGRKQLAIALSQSIPLVLQGNHQVNSWSPTPLPGVNSDTIARVAGLYADDEFFLSQFKSALATRQLAGAMDLDEMPGMGRRPMDQQPGVLIQAAGSFLANPDGARIAVIEMAGWDTHANQGAANGQLANRFSMLDNSIAELKLHLGEAWKNTVILVVSEFGRTVAVNGTNGTDHGTAGVVFAAGGAVSGGKILTDWPGLKGSDLYEGRDLAPTLDMRSIFKSVLHHHLRVSVSALEKKIFPDSSQAGLIPGLLSG